MGILATIATYLFGRGLGPVTVPILALGLLVSLYHNFQGRRDAANTKIETAATNRCNAHWLIAISKKKEREALAAAQEAQELLKGEREINKGLNDDLDLIRKDHDALRTSFAAAGDKCLSDSVLTALGGREPVGRNSDGPAGTAASKRKPPGQ